MKEWFKARNVWFGAFAALTDAEAGRLAKALWQYTATGEQAELSGNEKGCFAMFLYTLQQDNAESGDLSEKRRNAGSKGGQQRVANQANQAIASFASDDQANQAIADNKNKNKNKNKSKNIDKEKDIKENPLKGVKESELDRAFDKFWAVYPRHAGKQTAKKSFLKIAPDNDLLNTMLSAVQKQKQTDQWSDPRYIPMPTTWLNGRRWEDEVTQGQRYPVKTVSAQQYSQREYEEDDLEDRLGVNDLFSADWKGVS